MKRTTVGILIAALAFSERTAVAQRGVAMSVPPEETRRTADELLKRPVTIDVKRVPLSRALDVAAASAGVLIQYRAQTVNASVASVTLRVNQVPLSVALERLLAGTSLRVVPDGATQLAIVDGASGARVATGGGITGTVVDAATKTPVVGANVSVEGTKLTARTNEQGSFQLSEVPVGSYTVVVRRLGYGVLRKAVRVADNTTVPVELALSTRMTPLEDVVTTVTGPQRRAELGNVVGVINADSLTREAPVSSVSDLLMGRVPGLQVAQGQGSVGGQVKLQVRGMNSLNLSNEPIVIIDGIRYKTSREAVRSDIGVIGFNYEQSSPLNDLSQNDIETIEVVKGPSAATLYGTDASNGVIVITTKRGRAGATRWNAFVKSAVMTIPSQREPDLWWGWGHNTSGATLPYSCTLLYQNVYNFCTIDSATTFSNPLNDPQYAPFSAAPTWNYGANVSGGRPEMRYYFSGDLTSAVGPLKMPDASARAVEAFRGVSRLPEEELRPNAMTKGNLRATLTTVPMSSMDLTFNTGYTHNNTRKGSSNVYRDLGARSKPWLAGGGGNENPAKSFATKSTDEIDRFSGAGNTQWRPTGWLSGRATLGLDFAQTQQTFLTPAGAVPDSLGGANDQWYGGGRMNQNRSKDQLVTTDLGLTASLSRGVWSSRTSVGAQYLRNTSDGLITRAEGLAPGASSINAGLRQTSQQTYDQTATLGTYVEEVVGFREQLFVTGALRADGASTFGQNYSAVVYPKIGVSWLVSRNEWLSRIPMIGELRLRYALGAAGRQPQTSMSLPNMNYATESTPSGDQQVLKIYGFGNPGLRPERVREQEGGFDADLFGGRLQTEMTWYGRRTTDQILNEAGPPGIYGTTVNAGLTTQHGVEIRLNAHLLDRRSVSWDVTAQHAHYTTKLVNRGDAGDVYSASGGVVEGYPLGIRFYLPVASYADANGDGVIMPSEVQMATTPVAAGVSVPPTTQTLSTTVGLMGRRLRLSALLDRRTGFTQLDQIGDAFCWSLCRASVDRTAPIEEQLYVAAQSATVSGDYWYLQRIRPKRSDFTRLREVSLAFDVPPTIVRMLRGRSATFTTSARNLALWSRFGNRDPESSLDRGSLSNAVDGLPQARTWMVRLDVGF